MLKARGGAGLKRVASVFDSVRHRPAGIAVLIYHRVGGRTGVPVDLPHWLFRQQMAELSGRAISLDDALAHLAGDLRTEAGDPPPVVVTFDDGTADLVDDALPILVEHKIPALLYVATQFIDEGRCFPDDGRPASWAGLADAASTGYLTLGSHTHSHALLDRVDDRDVVADELDRSIDRIHANTGIEVTHFAYPKALPGTPVAERLVRQRFASAALAGTKINRVGHTDPWRLARSPIQVTDGMRWFRAKADGGLRLEDDVRRTVNRVRYRGLTE